MKNIVIYGNCHTIIIIKCLLYSKTIQNKMNIKKIYIVDYLENEKLDDNSIEILKSADIFLCQYIERDRGELNHDYIVKNYLKNDCIFIYFPHYRFDCYLQNNTIYNELCSGLGYAPKIPIELVKLFCSTKTYDEFNNNFNTTYENIKMIDSNLLNDIIQKEQNNFKKINSVSSIDMYDYVINNYKKERLFGFYSYPSEKFFYEFVKKILETINIYDMTDYCEKNDCIYNIWNNTLFPIIPQIYDYLQLQHKTTYDVLTIKEYCTNIESIQEYFYKIIKIFYEKNDNFNLKYEKNKLLILNNLNINYYTNYEFINNQNYLIDNIYDKTIIKEIINEPKINYSFGLLIPINIKNINLINNNINIKINAIFLNEDGKNIDFINIFDGVKWLKNIVNYNDEIFTINIKTSSKPRINFGTSKIIKIEQINVYYYF